MSPDPAAPGAALTPAFVAAIVDAGVALLATRLATPFTHH